MVDTNLSTNSTIRFERITTIEGALLALISYQRLGPIGLEFFTQPCEPAQIAYIRRKGGHSILPHYHPDLQSRSYQGQPEILFIQSGRVRVDFYDVRFADDMHPQYLASRELVPGDVCVILAGGHGCEILEECEMVEVRLGSYRGNPGDKVRFDPTDRVVKQ